MLRAPTPQAIKAIRHLACGSVRPNASRALASSPCVSSGRQPQQRGDSRVVGGSSNSSSSSLMVAAVAAAAAATAAAAAGTGSPAQAEGVPAVSHTNAVSSPPPGTPSFGSGPAPPQPPPPAAAPADGDASSKAGEGGDWEGDGNKMGLQLSALFVQRALMVFRRERAAMRVVTPPIEFREEHLGGGPTLSASFHLPRSANVLRVISAMVSADQVMEVKQPILDKAGASISFCEKDRTGSLLIRQDASQGPRGGKDSIHLYRDGGFTKQDLAALVQGYQEAWSGLNGRDVSYRFVIAPGDAAVSTAPTRAPESATGAAGGPSPAVPGSKAAGAEKLRQLGLEVHDKTTGETPQWDSLAGYADVKQEIEDTLILPLRHPEVYDIIARKTRSRFESNRPRAVLFEGPPGTGKTMSARIIAGRSDRPMVHVPVENIMSKWYGESEKKLSAIFDACDEMGGAIIFIDEVDALAGSRSTGGMHEATRRVLSVILQKVEGFEKGSKNILICATNRKDDLDSALISRFQLSIEFGLPDAATRRAVFGLYAKQLSDNELETLATITAGMSGRDMKETCQHAERRWASKLVRGQETAELPTLKEYVNCVDRRSREGAWQSRPAQA